jgi:hypothetical protein
MPNIKAETKFEEDTLLNADQYVIKKSAARALNISTRQLTNITKEGHFHVTKVGNKLYYALSEILDYKKRKTNSVEFTKETMNSLYAKNNRLEERIKMIERVLDMYYEPLQLTNLQLHALYKSAKEYDFNHSSRSLQSWGEIFLRLNDEHFMQLSKYLEEDHPWKPFYEIAYIAYGIARRKEFLELRRFLSKGLKNLRNSIVIYLERSGKRYGKLAPLTSLNKLIKIVKPLKKQNKDTEEVE